MIKLINLNKIFKNGGGVKDINITIKTNSLVGLIGENGAGKTTIMKLIFQELKKTSGKILLNGVEIKSTQSMKTMALFPDTNNIPLDMSVYEFAKYMSILGEIEKDIFETRFIELVEIFDLEKWTKKKIYDLSAGMKKRATMVATLITLPKIIFFDEPTANLDSESRINFISSIKKLNEMGITAVVTSHDLLELQELINHLVILAEGQVVYNQPFNSQKNKITDLYKEYTNLKTVDLDRLGKVYEN